MLVDFLGLLMAGSSQIVSSQVNRHFSTLALMREKMRAGSRLHSDVQKAGRGRTLYVTHVYSTVFPSLLEYLYPQGLMGVHTGASRNCGSQSFPSCTHSTRLKILSSILHQTIKASKKSGFIKADYVMLLVQRRAHFYVLEWQHGYVRYCRAPSGTGTR